MITPTIKLGRCGICRREARPLRLPSAKACMECYEALLLRWWRADPDEMALRVTGHLEDDPDFEA